jgi:acetamidase/formamidase
MGPLFLLVACSTEAFEASQLLTVSNNFVALLLFPSYFRFTETDYLETYAENPSDIFSASSIDPAMKNCYQQTRKFLMAQYGLTENEATSIITQGVDFGITQLVDGNWGIHAIVPKVLFSATEDAPTTSVSRRLMDADLPLSAANVHWGFFSKTLDPVLTIDSGAEVVVEMATHHACDDYDKMILGDAGMEDIYAWDESGRSESKRGATGGGDGVHILTGPIFVNDAEPGDLLKVEILDLQPRPNKDNKTYGSSAAAAWGYHARVPKSDGTDFTAGTFTDTPGSSDEVVSVYELMEDGEGNGYAILAYQFEWPTLTDPMGVERDYIGYPGTCVPHDPHGDTTTVSSTVADMGWTKNASSITYFDDVYRAKIPINYHIGCMGLAPESHDFVDSVPPMPSGGNLDNKRIGVGTTMYYPVEVAGAMLSMGDAHTAQGDSELDGTGIETSLTGKFKITVIKKADFTPAQKVLDFPLGETDTEWIVHGFTATDYLATFEADPSQIYGASSIDAAGKNAFAQTRKFIMAQYDLTEYEAWTIITEGIDFGITQVVDGNWGVHAIIPKAMFMIDEVNPPDGGYTASSKIGWSLSFIFAAFALV